MGDPLLIFIEALVDFDQFGRHPLFELHHLLNLHAALHILLLGPNCHLRVVVCVQAHSVFIVLVLSILPDLFPQLGLKGKDSVCFLVYIVIFHQLADV